MGLGKEKDAFVENLAMLFSSGMDIYFALESLKNETHSQAMKSVIEQLQEEISNGSPMWRAFQNVGFFPDHVISLIKIGEESGRLPENLLVISAQQQKERIFRSKIRSAMMYPVFVLVLSVVIALGISWFILPKLAMVFSQLKMELPFLTRILIWFGNFIQLHGMIFIPSVGILFALIIFFTFIFSKTKFIGQAIILHLPGVNNLIKEVEIGRFGFMLGTLLDAGVPVLNALQSIEQSSTVRAYSKLYQFIGECVADGNSFQKSFGLYKKSKKLIPSHIQNMLFASERSGNLPKTLLNIGAIYEEKTDTTTKNLAVILEPILLVVVWLGVVGIALAVIMPIYSLIGGLNNSNVKTTQAPAPVVQNNVETQSNIEDVQEQQPESVENLEIKKLNILKTGIGYLNVRAGADKKSKNVAKVKPGETYEYRSLENGWYEIMFAPDQYGWVIGDYVEVIDNLSPQS